MNMRCPKCGRECPDGTKFCVGCGAPMTPEGPQQNGPQQNGPQQNNYQQPGYQQNGYQQPGYQQPGYQQNGYQQNGYQQNGYQQPGYQQNGYQQNGYQQNGYQQPSYPQCGSVPIRKRSIAVCIILSIITCGLYGIYWFICMVNDLNVASDRPTDTSGGMVFLLGMITCGIYNLYWLYKAGEKVSYVKQKYTGYSDSDSGIIYLLLSIFGLGMVAWALIQGELNKVASY